MSAFLVLTSFSNCFLHQLDLRKRLFNSVLGSAGALGWEGVEVTIG